MKHHLDRADLLEILYLGETTEESSNHLTSCVICHDRLAFLRTTMEQDRAELRDRVTARPESFWDSQRDEIVSRVVTTNLSSFSFLRLRYALSAIMAILLVGVAGLFLRAAREDAAPTGTRTVVTETVHEELFEQDDLRAFDPWETEELESFHEVVEWETWLADDHREEKS